MIERMIQASLAAALLLLASGCRKPATPEKSAMPPPPPPAVETIARVHWMGKINAAQDTNLAGFMSIWNLPESTNLEAQVAARLATAPWRLIPGAPPLSNAPSSLLVPLIQDMIDHETYWELQEITNGPKAMTLAVRLPADKHTFWETNLAAICANLTRDEFSSKANGSWEIRGPDGSNSCRFTTEGDWVIWAFGQRSIRSGEDLPAAVTNGSPVLPKETNFLLAADFDLRRLGSVVAGGDWSSEWPRVAIVATGNGSGIRTRADFQFNREVPQTLEPWIVPTNMIHDPLVGFTAVNGIGKLLERSAWWRRLGLESSPDQLYIWSQMGMPFLSYFAAPASPTLGQDVIHNLGTELRNLNSWMTNNAVGYFSAATNRIIWAELPLISPFIAVDTNSAGTFLVGGLVPAPNANQPMPQDLLIELHNSTNLCFYDWELTGPRLEQWLNFGQLIRFVLGKAQLAPSSRSFVLLRSLEGRLENAATRISITGEKKLTLVRNSTVGMTACELLLLGDWLEAPEFPKGINTLAGKPEIINSAKKKPGEVFRRK